MIPGLIEIMEERDEARAQVAALQAEAKAAAKAPARFRRITARTKLTVPCVMAREVGTSTWESFVCETESGAGDWSGEYTHWLPFQWPEVRG